MSHASPRNPRASRATFEGLPTGSAIGIMCAALFTGSLLSVYAGQISWPFLALFAIAAIMSATLVNPRGLFVTVALTPILFVAAVAATGWFIATGASSGATGISRTDVLVIFYPLLQLFPVLAAATIGSVVIAVARVQLLKRHNEALARKERAERRRAARSNHRTSTEGKRARERTVTVSELREIMERREGAGARSASRRQAPRSTRTRRSLTEDLYGGER
ncbi:hypothetical protein G7Y29_03745 [Corynebacterium qintianiae]|uniref:DUF6542 domain-containing protein n=1 Tax=Corynebacterium qintianiae TaxID=2709392 RepID=A0A7T0KNE1_9CORY|nr:DUF6542 domain-containing protein [Corynebacterium qintianiae]QPK83916.1 hypothetical protein G7Y29_03745 [Corynebacterium qintianiae]